MGCLGTRETGGSAGTGLYPSRLDLWLPNATFRTQPLVLSFGHLEKLGYMICAFH